MNRMFKALLSAAAILGATAQVWAAPAGGLDQAILDVQHQWAHINYQLPEGKRADAFKALEKQEDALIARYPGSVEPVVWKGITLSSHAGVAGAFSALHLAEQARDLLLQAEKKDPDALHGSIFTSLGTLYAQVPGWPLGFGNNDTAKTYFNKALKVNPAGIDPNYFYAQYLYDHDHYKQALAHLQAALKSPPRPARPLADKGRRGEVNALLAKVRSKMSDSVDLSQVMK